jgi:hypothetical protein
VAWQPKAKRHCAYQQQKTVTSNAIFGGTNTNYVKRRPAVITGFATDTNPILRVRHHGETYGSGAVGVPRQVNSTASVPAARASKYVSQ